MRSGPHPPSPSPPARRTAGGGRGGEEGEARGTVAANPSPHWGKPSGGVDFGPLKRYRLLPVHYSRGAARAQLSRGGVPHLIPRAACGKLLAAWECQGIVPVE